MLGHVPLADPQRAEEGCAELRDEIGVGLGHPPRGGRTVHLVESSNCVDAEPFAQGIPQQVPIAALQAGERVRESEPELIGVDALEVLELGVFPRADEESERVGLEGDFAGRAGAEIQCGARRHDTQPRTKLAFPRVLGQFGPRRAVRQEEALANELPYLLDVGRVRRHAEDRRTDLGAEGVFECRKSRRIPGDACARQIEVHPREGLTRRVQCSLALVRSLADVGFELFQWNANAGPCALSDTPPRGDRIRCECTRSTVPTPRRRPVHGAAALARGRRPRSVRARVLLYPPPIPRFRRHPSPAPAAPAGDGCRTGVDGCASHEIALARRRPLDPLLASSRVHARSLVGSLHDLVFRPVHP